MTNKIYWFDYLFLFTIGTLFLIEPTFQPEMIGYILVGILFLTPIYLLQNKHSITLSLILIGGLTFFYPSLAYFIPATLRAILKRKHDKSWQIISITLFLIVVLNLSIIRKLTLITLSLLSWYLSEREVVFILTQKELLELKDESWEQQTLLENQTNELIEKQDALLELNITKERNRIARDIHDNVGHLLSSAIIQLGAVKTVNQDTTLDKMLNQIDTSLQSAMTSIRHSVHNLHESSLSFAENIEKIMDDFHFCAISYEGSIPENLSTEQQNFLLTIIKEALTNIMKHSNATKVVIMFDTMPAFYRVKIMDNGNKANELNLLSDGIGITSMRQRANDVNGQIHIKQSSNGFQLYIILPKETIDDTRSISG